MLSEFSSSMKEESMRCFPCGSLTKYVQGSTFVPFEDTIYIQLGIGEEGKNTMSCVKSDRYEGGKRRRSWARSIYIVQTEDINCYGTQFQVIPSLRGGKDVPSMMVWSMLSSIKEFWHVVDNIDGPF